MADEVVPLKGEDKDGLATYRQLMKFVKSVRRDQSRVNCLRLWPGGVQHNGRANEASEVWWNDHPSIQAILERRDRYNELAERMGKLKGLLEDGEVSAEARVDGYRTYDNLQRQLSNELRAIEENLQDMRREFAGSAKTMAGILVEAAKMRHAYKVHQDRMDLAKGADPAHLSSAELLKIADPDEL